MVGKTGINGVPSTDELTSGLDDLKSYDVSESEEEDEDDEEDENDDDNVNCKENQENEGNDAPSLVTNT